ncbi:MAG: ferritin-like domain-containing protein [Deltaproteobacteria bacterium]|nr:ferritin-like domain-containing protein [Deltaproteobacteria bacterium]
MELRDWAEVILHGPDLGAKLLCPQVLTDEAPGAPGNVPRAPGRDPAISWLAKRSREKVAFPTLSQMERDDQRGIVLHFFANHELLALELMALALLRFPDAPAAFRRGIAGVMREEQSHLRRYLQRMSELGVPFGAVPVNSYFWDVMAPTPSPLVFVTQMALTFEQANLDFAQYFLRAFQKVGDQETAALMDLVYREEIGHVGHGVKWFNQWRDPGESDWQAYKRILPLPLTPARAKGQELQSEARRAAGLSAEFVRELGLYRHSKGRPPRLFWFNPEVEEELAFGGSYTAPKSIEAWQHDLASLMQFLAGDDDCVLVAERPSPSTLERLLSCGFVVPQFVTPSERDALKGRLFERWHPWGQSPAALREAKALGVEWQQQPVTAPPSVFNKSWAKSLAQKLGVDEVGGGVCHSVDGLSELVAAMSARGDVVIKAPLGCSGRHMQRVRSGHQIEGKQLVWAERILKQQGSLVVESWVKRIADYSVQIDVQESGGVVLGITRFLTDQRGAYLGHVLGVKHAGLDPLAVRAYHELGVPETLERIGLSVAEALSQAGYLGPAGIDAFLYEDAAGIKLRPLVEINARYTMGRIALELDRRVHRKARGHWRHWTLSQIKREGFADFPAFLRAKEERHPLLLKHGLIERGVVATNDPATARAVLTLIEIV